MTRIILKNSETANKRPNPADLQDGEVALNTYSLSPGVYFRVSPTELVKAGPTHVGSSAPNSTPAGFAGNCIGELWFQPTGEGAGLKLWDGAVWQVAGGVAGSTGNLVTTLGVGAGDNAKTSSSGAGAPVFIGYQAGQSMDSRVSAVAIGSQALKLATQTSINNVAIGDQALSSITTNSTDNTFVGYQAGLNAVGVNNAVAFGSQALQKAQSSASQSVAVGAHALQNATTGINLAIGAYQGVDITTGTNNILIGTSHPQTGGLTTGSDNLIIGNSSYGVGDATDNLVLGNGHHLDTNSNHNVIAATVVDGGTISYTNNSNNVIVGICEANPLASGVSNVVAVGKFGASFVPWTESNSLIVCTGAMNRPNFAINANGAWGVQTFAAPGLDYGTDGQILTTKGFGASPQWITYTVPQFSGTTFSSTFVDANGKTVTIENGLVTNIA